MKELYQLINDRIATWKLNGGTTGNVVFNHVDLWNKQTDHEKDEIPFNTPAAFIHFEGINYRAEGGRGVQKADISLQIFVVFNVLSEDDITIMDTVDQLAMCLNGFQGERFTGMVRTEMEQDVDHDGVIIWAVSFIFTFSDSTTDLNNRLVSVTPTTLVVNADLDIDNDVIRTGDGNA